MLEQGCGSHVHLHSLGLRVKNQEKWDFHWNVHSCRCDLHCQTPLSHSRSADNVLSFIVAEEWAVDKRESWALCSYPAELNHFFPWALWLSVRFWKEHEGLLGWEALPEVSVLWHRHEENALLHRWVSSAHCSLHLLITLNRAFCDHHLMNTAFPPTQRGWVCPLTMMSVKG